MRGRRGHGVTPPWTAGGVSGQRGSAGGRVEAVWARQVGGGADGVVGRGEERAGSARRRREEGGTLPVYRPLIVVELHLCQVEQLDEKIEREVAVWRLNEREGGSPAA